MKKRLALTAGIIALLIPCSGEAISLSAFGPQGEGGNANGQSFTIGSGGDVFELDAFVNIAGLDLNGGGLGTSSQLSIAPLPSGLNYNFSSALSPDSSDLTLTYRFSNNTGGALSNFRFFSFIDPEIDEPTTTFFNEYGATAGVTGVGAADPDPDSWEIDEPGFVFGDIFDNLWLGALDNSNAVPIGFPEDVSMALGFNLGTLNPMDTATIAILISEDGTSVGSLALSQFDTDPDSSTVITFSGQAAVTSAPPAVIPEPGTVLLFAAGFASLAVFRRKTKQ